MIEIKVPSQQRYAYVELMKIQPQDTYFLFGWDFNNLTKRELTSASMSNLQKRLTKVTRKLVVDKDHYIKKLSLEYIVKEIKETTKERINHLIDNSHKHCPDPAFTHIFENQLNAEIALLERLNIASSVFVTFSIDENNDTFVIHDSFQNGQQMLNFTQTTQGLVHQIDVKRANTSNQGELLISIKYQKEG